MIEVLQRRESCMQEFLFQHFRSNVDNGFLNDASITRTDKIDSFDPKKTKLLYENFKDYSTRWA